MRWIGGGLDKRNLEQRRQGWYAVKDVRPSLVPLVGRKRLRVSLKTREHRIALLRRPAALAQLEAIIARATGIEQGGALLQEAMEIKQKLTDPTILYEIEHPDGTTEPIRNRDFLEEAIEHFEAAALRARHPDVPMLVNVALGQATPIEAFTEAWLAEKDIEERSKGEYRLAVQEVIQWAAVSDRMPTIEAFDRKTAGAYVTALRARPLSRATAGKRLSALSSMWGWLSSKGHVEANVWRGHGSGAVPRSERAKEPERPFTDDEISLLLDGKADTKLADLMRLAALSGMRLEEIAMLRVRDVDLKDRTMLVRDPKTPASRRTVPIHPDILATVTTRVQGKDPEAFVMHELGPEPKPGRQRSMAASKAFSRYRQAVGVHDARTGQRRSLVNFHSYRRWFITKAEQAGQPENIIKSVVGRGCGSGIDGVHCWSY